MKILKKIRLTIGTKLVGLIALLLMASVTSLVWLSTNMFTEDTTALIKQTNADTAASIATQMRELFESTNEKMRIIGTVLMQDMSDIFVKKHIVEEFFSKDQDLLLVAVHKHDADGAVSLAQKATSPTLTQLNDADGTQALDALSKDKDFSLAQVAKGEIQMASLRLSDGSAALAISLPLVQGSGDQFSHTVTAVLRQNRFVKTFSDSDIITSYMVDRRGRLLAHPDASRVAAGESVAHLDIVKELLTGKANNKQMRYSDGEWKLGAFRVVGFAGLGVVSEVPEAKALETSERVKFRSMLMALIILCVSFFLGYAYSTSITAPIRNLVMAAGQISEGDFKINLAVKGNDELTHLSTAFNEMAKGLEERDRVKDTFNKFHNKEIAEKLLSGEVKLGGERKEATIFFSDVRGFTGMSETMEPEQVVEMLNEYMTRMVSIIRKHGGIVDKYVGDAIMALWGIPLTGPSDPQSAIMACLEMRADLEKLNAIRIGRGQPALKIGMGLNLGSVIAGNIGSIEKMEYTVIGDSVNLASRMESMTKEYGTDLLISSNVYEKTKDFFVFEQCKSARVKGKSQAIEVFKVLGYRDENNNPVIIETPYSSYAAERSDKAVHDPEPKTTDTVTARAAVNWYVQMQGETFGPFTLDEVVSGIKAGELNGDMLACTDLTQPSWMPFSSYSEFSNLGPTAAAA